MVGKKNNSLQGKKFCEPCGKDISTSYFSKHLKTIGHLRNADKSPAPKESSDESSASVSSSSDEQLKLDKIISSSEEEESESEQEQEQEQPVDEKKDTSQSEEEEESEESEQESEEEEEESEPSPEPSPEPVKKSKRVKKNVKVKVEKQKSKPKPKKAGLYALSSSEEEPDQSVNPSGFLKFVNTLNNDFDITEADDIKKVFNSVMGFGKSSYHINPSVKNQLSRYLNKYERDNSHLDEDTVHQYLSEFLSNY